jgi:hypothetical protein
MTTLSLTGTHDTCELPRLTNSEHVTVTVARVVAARDEGSFRTWA